MAEPAELVIYVDILEAVVVAKIVERAKVVGTTVTFDKSVALEEAGLAELEPVTMVGTRTPVEMVK